MKLWLHKIELYVDTMIPYLLFILIGLLTMDYFFNDVSHTFGYGVISFDYIVMLFLMVDLAFKYHRARGVKSFLRHNWLQIIAAYPFALTFRMVERFMILGTADEAIGALYNQNKIEIYFIRLARELQHESILIKSSRLLRFLAAPSHLLRGMQFFEKPTGKHYHNEKR